MVSAVSPQKLTQRQKEILRLLLNGFDAKSVALHLGISVHTVNEHLREARRHLGVSNSREAARILSRAESIPPNTMGPDGLGVVHPISGRLWSWQPGQNRWPVYAGVSLVILLTAAAIAFSIANGGVVSERPDAPTMVAAAPPQTESEIPKSYESRDVPIAKFDRLKVSGPFKVGVLAGGESAELRLLGPPALLADTIATVEGDTLTIRFREGAAWSWNQGSGVTVFAATPKLAAASLEGAANVEIMGVRGDTFSAATGGSGTIVLRGVDVGHVGLATGGAGGITVEGSARKGVYVVGSSGSIDAKRLRVERASIGINGAGSVYADVSGTAHVSMRGSGRVDVVGGGTCVTQPVNSLRVACR